MATVATNPDNAVERYTATAIALHWIIALLIVANLAIGLLAETAVGRLFFLHKPIGITILVVSVVRILWRLGHPAPPLPAEVPSWNRLLAHANQWLLYAAMILMPLSGWVFTSAAIRRRPLSFGLFDVPPLPVPQSEAVNAPWHEGHVIGGWILLALVVLHVAGALRHWLVARDSVFGRMLPS